MGCEMQLFRKIKIGSIFSGFLIDTIGSMITSSVFGAGMGVYYATHGLSQTELSSQLFAGYTSLLFLFIIGSLFTILGGYVAGRMAKQFEILHGGLVGAISLFAYIVLLPWSESPTPIWYEIVSAVTVIPFGIFGGHLAKNKNACDLTTGASSSINLFLKIMFAMLVLIIFIVVSFVCYLKYLNTKIGRAHV